MADKKNLCAQIDIALHNRVTDPAQALLLGRAYSPEYTL